MFLDLQAGHILLLSYSFFILFSGTPFFANSFVTFKSYEKLGAKLRNSAIDTFNFREIIDECSKTSIYTPAVIAAEKWLSSGKPLSSGGITQVIKIFGLANLVEDAKRVLRIARDRGFLLNVYHYNTCINACSKHKYFEDAIKLYEEMQTFGIPPDVVTYSTIIGVYGSLGDPASALQLFNKGLSTDADIILYNSILSALRKCDKPKECCYIFENMKKSGVKPSIHSYNSIISATGNAGDWETAYQYFNEMCEKMLPDKITILTMINVLDKSRKYELAATVKQRFPLRDSTNYSSSTSTRSASTSDYHIIENHNINILNNQLNNNNNNNKLNSMKSHKVISFTNVIREAKRTGDFRAAVKAADDWLLVQKELTPGGVTSCLSIFGYARLHEKALALLERLKQDGKRANVQQYNACMTACVRSGAFEKALEMFEKMDEEISPGANSTCRDVYSYTTALTALERSGKYDLAYELFASMDKVGVPKNTFVYNVIITALGKAGKWEEALKSYGDMRMQQILPDKSTFYSLVSALERGGEFALAAKIKDNYAMSNKKKSNNIMNQNYDLTYTSNNNNNDMMTSNDNIDDNNSNNNNNIDMDAIISQVSEKMALDSNNNNNVISQNNLNLKQSYSYLNDENVLVDNTVWTKLPNLSAAGTLRDKLLEHSGISTIRMLGMLGKLEEAVECLESLRESGGKVDASHYNAACKILWVFRNR